MKKGVILLFVLLLVLPSVWGIGIAPDSSTIDFEPFLEGNLTIHIINTDDFPINATVNLEGDFAKYFMLVLKLFNLWVYD